MDLLLTSTLLEPNKAIRMGSLVNVATIPAPLTSWNRTANSHLSSHRSSKWSVFQYQDIDYFHLHFRKRSHDVVDNMTSRKQKRDSRKLCSCRRRRNRKRSAKNLFAKARTSTTPRSLTSSTAKNTVTETPVEYFAAEYQYDDWQSPLYLIQRSPLKWQPSRVLYGGRFTKEICIFLVWDHLRVKLQFNLFSLILFSEICGRTLG
jgi:hypothetical protein